MRTQSQRKVGEEEDFFALVGVGGSIVWAAAKRLRCSSPNARSEKKTIFFALTGIVGKILGTEVDAALGISVIGHEEAVYGHERVGGEGE